MKEILIAHFRRMIDAHIFTAESFNGGEAYAYAAIVEPTADIKAVYDAVEECRQFFIQRSVNKDFEELKRRGFLSD